MWIAAEEVVLNGDDSTISYINIPSRILAYSYAVYLKN